MKRFLVTAFLGLCISAVFAQDITVEQQKLVQNFIDCVKQKKKEKLATYISFPLKRDYPIPAIKNRQEFIRRYDEVFDENLVRIIINSKPSVDWSAVGWRGIMLFHGDVWLNYGDGKLIAVNYQSTYEKNKKEELIRSEKLGLHASIKEFKEPVYILETIKYRIRIDDLGDGNYRYSSWHISHKMSDKPDLVIQNGVYEPQGSGGNHIYRFRNGDYVYECMIQVMGEDGMPPAYLSIYKSGKEIFSQKAYIVMK